MVAGTPGTVALVIGTTFPPVEVHRPLHPAIGWGILAVPTVPFAILLTIDPGPLAGLAILFGLGIPLTYGLGEVLLLEHRLYEHGVVYRSIPGLPVYVIPHYTIDPDWFAVGERHLNRSDGFEAPNRRYRQCPFIKTTIDFDGLDPKYAKMLGKNKVSWAEAGREPLGIKGSTQVLARPQARWMVTYRDADTHLATMRATVRASQQVDPYYEPENPGG